ncbi:MAG TPA: hypothetical protein PLV65_09620, partial [Tenuifilaceae bacterium]|nr:hypothetical protein [Tenuifilaceae bacterium]
AIVSDCTTKGVAGVEVTAWMFNRKDFTLTYDGTTPNLITNIAAVAAATTYQLTGYKMNMNVGHDVVVRADAPDGYKHFFSFKQYQVAAANILNVDNINDVVVVVEAKNKPSDADGVFLIYGAKYGLFKSADTHRINDNNAERSLELTSLDGQEEPYSRYVLLSTDYATTKALLEGLD